jgi:uncharacterized protein
VQQVKERPLERSSAPRAERPKRRIKLRVHSGLRWVHIYISMISLLIVFFFAITGITLNHPDWLFGSSERITDVAGSLPASWRDGETVDWLRTVEHLRSEQGVRGAVTDYRIDEFEGSIAFRSPGYAADVFIDPATGAYQLSVATQGFVGFMNELHRGKDAPGAWKLAIDLAGVLLALLSVTGMGLLLYIRKYRVSALATMAVGTLVVILLMASMR